MALTDEDFELLGSLRGMRVFATTLQEIVNDPSRDLDSFEDKIKEALDAQVAARDSKVIEKLVKAAKLPNALAALERFEAHSNRGITPDRIERLATCDWITYGRDLTIVGATGTGKSFLAQGLAVAACRHKLTARYFRLADLRLPSFSGHPISADFVSVGEDVHCESTTPEIHAGVPA